MRLAAPGLTLALALLLAFASSGSAQACSYLPMSEAEWRAAEFRWDRERVAEADFVYFGSIWNTGGIARKRYTVRGGQPIRGGQPPWFARTPARYETSCGRMPEFSIDSVRRLRPNQEVIVVARRRGWFRVEIVEVARKESVRGRRLAAFAREGRQGRRPMGTRSGSKDG